MKTSHGWKETHNEKIFFGNLALKDPNFGLPSTQKTHRVVNFYCLAPQAAVVELVGDFNHWQSLTMQRVVAGWWLAAVPLDHGRYRYRFLVDGKPTLDPYIVGVVRDEQGEPASLLEIG